MIDNIFINKTITGIQDEYRKRLLDPVVVARHCISRVEEFDNVYHAWVCLDKDALLKKANECQVRLARGLPMRPLEGIPVGVKDIFNTIEYCTEMGSPLWKDFAPGNDSRAIFYVKQAGGMITGKTVTAEFAVHTLDHKTLNPHDRALTPGTSSSGSAVAIALGMVPIALGTQTAGSIVRPASFCGIYGCKPSFGLIPRTGMLKTTDSLDTIGFFTAQCEDLERVFNVLRVHGPNYPFSYKALRDHERQSKPDNRPWRVALVKTHTWEYAYDYAKRALMDWVDKLSTSGDVEVSEPKLPKEMNMSHEIHRTIYDKTLSYYFKEEFKKSELVSPIMNELIVHGNEITTTQYIQALRDQEFLAHVMDDFLQRYDALISLSTAGEAPPREEVEKPDPALMWTLAHLPVISAPAFISPRGMPFGIQIVARKYNDILLFKFINKLRSAELIPARCNPIF